MINLLLELYRSLRGLPRPEVPETIGEDNKVPIFYDTSVLDRCELYRSHQVMRKLGMDWLYKEHTWYKVPPIHVYDIRRRNLRNNGTDIDTLLQDNDRMDDAELDIVDITRIVIDECSSENIENLVNLITTISSSPIACDLLIFIFGASI